MRKYSIWDAIISVVAISAVCATVVPAVARLQRTPEDATCQANMRRWGEAMRLYMADCDDTYPVNRAINGVMICSVKLSPYDPTNPKRFVSGVNWVEAMFPYLMNESKKTGRDWQSFMKCPNASPVPWANSQTARMTYVLNYNLLAQPSLVIRDKAKLMMMREFDRLMESVCRPMNRSSGSGQWPQSPFLTESDYGMRSVKLDYKQHGQGSYILFADGHVKYFGSEFFPNRNVLVSAESWDNDTQQWWNWVNNPNCELNKAIAVTP